MVDLAMTSILLDPAEVAGVRESGWSGTHHSDPTTGERIVGTSDGLGFGLDESWHNPREMIAWADVEAIAKSVPTQVREHLAELRDRLREHRRAYPRFVASADAAGCGPIIEGQPLTPRQEAYVRELEAFEASGVLQAWEPSAAVLDAQRLELHKQALTGGDQEPADLLDLLEDQDLRQSAATRAEPAPGRTWVDPDVHQEAGAQNTTAAERTATGQRPALLPPTTRPRSSDELQSAVAVQRRVAR